MDESPQSKPLPPKRSSRLRLIVLLITLALMTAVYLPLRTSRANDRLYQGLMMGDTEMVRDALAGGADPDLAHRPPEARSRPGSLLDFVRLILRRGLRPTTNNARTALMSAAGSGNVEIVSELLQHNANVNLRLDNGYSALLYAASKQPPDIVAALLAKGADVHAHTRDGATPLLLAAQTGQTQNVRLLLAKGADLHEIDLFSHTALALAAENRHEETVQFLLSQGANERDLNAPGPPSMVPAMRFTTSGPNRSIITINGTTTIVQSGPTIPLTRQLLPNGTLPPLIFAAKCASPSLLRFLWKRADPDTKRKLAWGVLCDTVQSGQIESVRFLLNENLPVNPPHDTAAKERRIASVPTGYDPSKVYTPLHYAAAQPKPDIAAMLIARGANVNAEDMFGTTPLLAAAVGAHLETMRLLIAHGANVRAAERHSGQNALMRGVQNVEVARLLLDHGLDINARDRNGRTALMQCYSLPVATLLVARGADVKARDMQGNTALLTAIRSMQPDFVKLLLAHGADVNSVNDQGETPLSAARSMRFAPLITLLTSAGAKR